MQILCFLKDIDVINKISETIKDHDVWHINSIDKLLKLTQREYDISKSDILIVTDIENRNQIEDLFKGHNICYVGKSDDYDILNPDYCHESLKLVINNILKNKESESLSTNLFNAFEDYMDLNYYCKVSPDIQDILKCDSKHLLISSPKHLMQHDLAKFIALKHKTAPYYIEASKMKDIEIMKLLFGETTSDVTTNGLCHYNNITIIINNAEKLSMMIKRKIYQLCTNGKFTRVNGRYPSLSQARFIFITRLPIDDKSGELYLYQAISQSFQLRPISEWDKKLRLLLFMFYIEKYYHENIPLSFSKEATEYLSNYKCDNNIREIKEVASFVVRHLGVDTVVKLKHLPSDVVADVTDEAKTKYNEWLKVIVDYNIYNFYDVNRIIMAGAFKLGDCYHRRASKIYGVAESTWRKRVRKYGLDVDGIKKGDNVIADIIEKYRLKQDEEA